MANFCYQALNADRGLVTGELEAESVQRAIAQLETHGLTVQSIGQAAPASREAVTEPAAGAATRTANGVDQLSLRPHVARVLEAGPAIAPALQAFAEEMPGGRRRRELQALARLLQRGDAAEAERAFAQLPEYWIPLLSAATPPRDPGRIVSAFLEEWQQADELRRQWWAAFAYPFVVACLAATVLTAISILIIPGFREIFEEFDLELPGLTLLIVRISDWVNSGGIIVIIVAFLLFGALALYARRSSALSMRGWLGDRLRLPFGRSTAIARFARYTADLLEAGLTLPEALKIAGISSNRRRVRSAAWRVAHALESGHGAAAEIDARPLTATVLHAVRSQMPTAARIRLLKEISASHADRAHGRLSWARGIAEPIAVVVIGLAVGMVVLALFLPLIKLVEGLSM